MNNTANRQSLRRGFSLIEAMVALGVMSVASVGAMMLMASSFALNNQARHRAEVAEVAEKAVNSFISATNLAKNSDQFYGVLNSTEIRDGCGACSLSGCPQCTKNHYHGHSINVRTSAAAPSNNLLTMVIEVDVPFANTVKTSAFLVTVMVP
ncbi:MAG: type II secretion system protein [Deltaproteobacteria bacterium]|nr:type II secretion system protein [Deltaproteobacteria bacterium]